MTLLGKVLEGNRSFQSTYVKYADKLPSKPRKNLAILTCTDTRLNPIRIFHINVGDAEILRNAGNKITDDVIRSLTTAIANGITEIIILGHTDCSLTKLNRLEVVQALHNLGASLNLTSLITFNEWLGTFTNEEINVRNQVTRLRSSSAIPPTMPIHGLLFDVVNGSLKLVVNGYKSLKPVKDTSAIGLLMSLPSLKMPEIYKGSIFSSLKKQEAK